MLFFLDKKHRFVSSQQRYEISVVSVIVLNSRE